MRHQAALLLCLLAPLTWAADDVAQKNCTGQESALVVSLQGTLEYDPVSKGQWKTIQLNQTLCEGSRIHVGPYSRASVLLPNDVVVRIDEDTVLTFNALNPEKPALMDLLKGFVHFISRTPKHLQINTPIANAGPEGTEFALSVNNRSASLWVYEGGVKFFNNKGSLSLKPGQGAQAFPGQTPVARIDIKPVDAVNWALYYPALLPYPDASMKIDGNIRTAIQDFRQGRIIPAISRLNSLPPDKQTPYFYKVRGAMLLTVGRVQLAQQDITTLFKQNPKDAEALALQSVLALTQNRKEEAYDLAKQAITSNPQSASAYSALSYAEQGRFELEKALQTANQATKLASHDAMVWARKAELELALGLTSDSESTVQQAEKLDADLERTQTIIGFSHLQQMDADKAMQAFDKALKLDSTSPLARLGLGLAKIRNGDLEEGRQDLEIAAILDPNNSLIRSYLGKAYYEENRNPLAEDQFNLAKERDPKDPTPYFYNALKKQTENRPVEALQDLQKAIELNDNRAVYRSKQLLDSDRAARGASLARVYNNLGFEQRGVIEATSSLQIDPTNFSAHRFLSDTYVVQQDRETAQLSELLQAKMLQPIIINPVQPHLSVSDRGLLNSSGIANSSFQDFTRVFEHNKPQLLLSGIAGTQNSFGDEATLSGIYRKLSYSFGQYHFETDGVNNFGVKQNDQKATKELHDIYDVFLQSELTKRLNLQFEYLNRNSFLNHTNQDTKGLLNQNEVRTGFHFNLSESQDLLGFYKYTDIDIKQNDDIFIDTKDNIKSNLWEGQYINTGSIYRLTSGFSYYDYNTIQNFSPTLTKQNGYALYVYPYLRLFDKLGLTLGLSYNNESKQQEIDIGNSDQTHLSKWNPKLGLQFDFTRHSKFRLAYITSFKKPLWVSQTLEPTQIAGFNQLFDDFNESSYKFYGAAIDFSWNGLFAGVEINHRRIFSFEQGTENLKRYTDAFKAYISYAIDNISFNTEYRYEKSNIFNNTIIFTHKIPVQLKYFNQNGLFFNINPTLILQDNLNNNSNSKFFVVDIGAGYRLPKRMGILSIELKNVFNDKFIYTNTSNITGLQSDVFYNNLEFYPQRTVFGRVTLNF